MMPLHFQAVMVKGKTKGMLHPCLANTNIQPALNKLLHDIIRKHHKLVQVQVLTLIKGLTA